MIPWFKMSSWRTPWLIRFWYRRINPGGVFDQSRLGPIHIRFGVSTIQLFGGIPVHADTKY